MTKKVKASTEEAAIVAENAQEQVTEQSRPVQL
jgi:hypothetical protein